jgi:hypothetical protein
MLWSDYLKCGRVKAQRAKGDLRFGTLGKGEGRATAKLDDRHGFAAGSCGYFTDKTANYSFG